MPQMSPMWWTTMFILFTIMLMIINTMNYFYKENKMSMSKQKKMISNKNWKW